MSIQDHIHLGVELTGSPELAPTGTYRTRFGALDLTPNVPAVAERGITGKLHIHALLDEYGVPVQFSDHSFQLVVPNADVATLKTLFGRVVYYVPIDHSDNDSAHTGDIINVFLTTRRGGVINLDPSCEYWVVTIELQATDETPFVPEDLDSGEDE